MRLIDADDIHYTRLLSQQGLDMELVPKAVIGNMPTIDAVEVAHGFWIQENIRAKSYLRLCSACRKIAYFCGMGCSYKFCPNCGCKMDAEVEE